MNKILTISIAAYNVENTIEKTLDSLVIDEAHMKKMEVIVVNDGSTDSTLEIARRYEKQYPDVIRIIDKQNGGYGSTINESTKIATGLYFRLLDGDDLYVTENLPYFIDFLSNCMTDIVLSPFYEHHIRNGKMVKIDCNSDIGEMQQSINNVSLMDDILMHGLSVRTDFWRDSNVKITENCFYTDNEYTFYALLHASTISRFELPIYIYSLGVEEQSVSHEGLKKHFKDYIKVASAICKEYSQRNFSIQEMGIQNLLQRKLMLILDNTYYAYLIVGEEFKNELIVFDKYIKDNYPFIYNMSFNNKKIKALRITEFRGYGLLCKIIKKKH